MVKTLYICYFGVREPLVQTQVLPYLRELQKTESSSRGTQPMGEDKLQVSLLTFEPAYSLDDAAIRKGLASEGIDWHWLPYHKRFSALATAWDILRGTMFIRRFIARERPDILHGRVHVPTLMGALARKLSRHKPKLLFDIRGFFPEEYIDAGVWTPGGSLYKFVKRVERWLMNEADGFVVLTRRAKEVLFPDAGKDAASSDKRPVEVIPCCVDLKVRFSDVDGAFREASRAELGLDNRYVVTHLGALGGLYLTEQIADFLRASRERDARTFAIFLTQSNPQLIIPLLLDRGFSPTDFLVAKVSPGEVPRYLAASDAALSFVKATYATMSRSPTKNAEYLACGVPIIANSGVGDVDELINENGVGVIVPELTHVGYLKALERVERLDDISERCRATASEQFDLETVGGIRYRRIYNNLIDPRQ